MRAKLFSKRGETKGAESLFEDEVTIGRGRESGVRIDHPSVSSEHARVYYDPQRGGWYLEDLDSLNGTLLDGLRVTRPERLAGLDVIEFGGVAEFFFLELAQHSEQAKQAKQSNQAKQSKQPERAAGAAERPASDEAAPEPAVGGAAETGAPGERTAADVEIPVLPSRLREAPEGDPREIETTRVERQPLVASPSLLEGGAAEPSPPRASEPRVVLEILSGRRAGDRLTLEQGENLLGRGRDADLVIEAADISRRHALFTVSGARVRVRDLGSRNQSFLEGEPFTDEIEVVSGSRLGFGSVEARVHVD